MNNTFYNRSEAGRLLAQKLKPIYANRSEVIVLGLPRGGIPVAYEIAQVLNAPLDICLVRKLGVPGHQELAMGAISTGTIVIINEDIVSSLGISKQEIEQVATQEWQELKRRDRVYRGDRPVPNLNHRIVILVDDGIATGSTLKAALTTIRQQQPKRIVIAVPVASPDICQELKDEVDEVVCLLTPEWLYSISLWYDDFSPTTDEEVCRLLALAANEKIANTQN